MYTIRSYYTSPCIQSNSPPLCFKRQVAFDAKIGIGTSKLQTQTCCMQIQGKDRAAVAEAGRRLGLDGTYIARSYIEQVTTLHCPSLHLTALHTTPLHSTPLHSTPLHSTPPLKEAGAQIAHHPLHQSSVVSMWFSLVTISQKGGCRSSWSS